MKPNNLKFEKNARVFSLLMAAIAADVQALEVDREVMPRITVGGRVMPTVDSVQLDSDTRKSDGVNLDDSTLLLRFDKRLYEDGIAGAVVGFKDQSDGIQFSELNTFYWNRDFRLMLGQSRLQNTLLEFPTLRDDDLFAYTHVGNASSNDAEFDGLYAKQLAADWYVDRKIQRVTVWGGTRRNGSSFVAAPDGFDSVGLGYVYQQPETLRYVKWLRKAGVVLDRQKVALVTGDTWMNAVIAGAEFNLNMDPSRNWSVGLQAIHNQGAITRNAADLDHSNADEVSNRAGAESSSMVASLRYTARPKLLTRWQAGLTVAYKDYADVNNGSQWSAVPSLFYRLGQGVDVVGQYRYTHYGKDLGGGTDEMLQLGLSFSFDAVFNDTIGKRASILNLEHGYLQ